MVKAVIFDIDGTLIDSVDLHAEAWQEALRHFGHDLPFERVRAQIGKGGDLLMPALLPEDEVRAPGEGDRGVPARALQAGVPPSREGRSRRSASCSSGSRRTASGSHWPPRPRRRSWRATSGSPGSRTSSMRRPRRTTRRNPSPTRTSSRPPSSGWKGSSRRTRSPWAIPPTTPQAAGKAGLRTIGLLCGGWPEAELREAGCIAIYRDPADLLRQYDRSPLAEGK